MLYELNVGIKNSLTFNLNVDEMRMLRCMCDKICAKIKKNCLGGIKYMQNDDS